MEIFLIFLIITLAIFSSIVSFAIGFRKGFNAAKEIDDKILEDLYNKYNSNGD